MTKQEWYDAIEEALSHWDWKRRLFGCKRNYREYKGMTQKENEDRMNEAISKTYWRRKALNEEYENRKKLDEEAALVRLAELIIGLRKGKPYMDGALGEDVDAEAYKKALWRMQRRGLLTAYAVLLERNPDFQDNLLEIDWEIIRAGWQEATKGQERRGGHSDYGEKK